MISIPTHVPSPSPCPSPEVQVVVVVKVQVLKFFIQVVQSSSSTGVSMLRSDARTVRGTMSLAKGRANLRPLLHAAPHASAFKAVQWLVLAPVTRLQIHAPTPNMTASSLQRRTLHQAR